MITGAAAGGVVIALGLFAIYGMERGAEQLMGIALAGLAVALVISFLRTRGFATHHRAMVLAIASVGTVVLSMFTIPANQLAPRTGLIGLAALCAAVALLAELLLRRRAD